MAWTEGMWPGMSVSVLGPLKRMHLSTFCWGENWRYHDRNKFSHSQLDEGRVKLCLLIETTGSGLDLDWFVIIKSHLWKKCFCFSEFRLDVLTCPHAVSCWLKMIISSFQLRSPEKTQDQFQINSHATSTSCSEQLQALDSARLLHNHRRQDLRLLGLQNMRQQSRETEKKVLWSPSTTSSLAFFHF